MLGKPANIDTEASSEDRHTTGELIRKLQTSDGAMTSETLASDDCDGLLGLADKSPLMYHVLSLFNQAELKYGVGTVRCVASAHFADAWQGTFLPNAINCFVGKREGKIVVISPTVLFLLAGSSKTFAVGKRPTSRPVPSRLLNFLDRLQFPIASRRILPWRCRHAHPTSTKLRPREGQTEE